MPAEPLGLCGHFFMALSMANLGTLWFGADIDMSALRNKIQQGNRDILDALKIDYSQDSYRAMVDKLRSSLSRETFEVNIGVSSKLGQQLSDAARQAGQSVENVTKNVNFGGGGRSAFNQMTADIVRLKKELTDVNAIIAANRKQMEALKKIESNSIAKTGRGVLNEAQLDKLQVYNELLAKQRALREQIAEVREKRGLLGVQLREENENARRFNMELRSMGEAMNTNHGVASRLSTAFASLFGLYQVRSFLSSVIEVGGQLEKQRISLGAILGDVGKANQLFEQIKGLAVKSPFGVVELDQYSKQLAAYGFKSHELFDMTKRLADIAAGAGTDIGRLANALGHVRSETALTGITLRMFSMVTRDTLHFVASAVLFMLLALMSSPNRV